jgi:hypothetical protein
MDAYELRKRQNAILEAVKARGARSLNDRENEEYLFITEQLQVMERKSELRGAADRIFNASENGKDMDTYRADDAYTERRHSYVRDLIGSVTPAVAAAGGRERLDGMEARDVTGLTSGTAFDPPQFLIDLYARVSRPNSPLYSLLSKVKLDSPVVKTPKITAGNTAGCDSLTWPRADG